MKSFEYESTSISGTLYPKQWRRCGQGFIETWLNPKSQCNYTLASQNNKIHNISGKYNFRMYDGC